MKRLAVALLFFSLFFAATDAQDSLQCKIGHVDLAKVYSLLPENQRIANQLAQLQAAYEIEIEKMGEEYKSKVSDFVAVQQSLEPDIAEARAQEIEQLQQRIQVLREKAAQNLQQQREEKTAPMIQRVAEALQQVAETHGFAYIFDQNQSNLLYCSPTRSQDLTPLLLSALGL